MSASIERRRLDAVVVGAGIVGSALALGLKRRGLDVAVVESTPPAAWRADAPDLRVYAIAPDSEALLGALEVWPAVRAARAQPYAAMQVWDAGGGAPLRFDAAALGVPRLGHIVEHGLLVDRLQAALGAAGVPILDAAVEGIDPGDDDATLRLSGERRIRASWVFGADGAASAVRGLAGIDLDSRDYAAKGLVAYLRTERPHDATCWQRFLPSGPLALLPCADGRVSIVWSLPQGEADRLAAVPEAQFNAEITRASDRVLGDLALDSPRIAFPLKRQLATRPREGRIALLGDAAHAVHPLAGQGVNLGLRDVGELLTGVDDALSRRRAPISETMLSRWARRRHSDNVVSARAFEAIHDVYSNAAPPAVALRGWALAAGNLPPLNRLLWGHAAGGAR
ncbi:FAD-dependent oxidoreductase [Silanimonas sp.]|jgi:2-octaprenyl-3-methyl-6-methoxy-1,4-benzoquinol hydroxylase|uniref:FAD-dependent oxidoreductase n=1 Tax=Silanimonas sp. TaxID=1929290 RepID=UPI0037C982F1